MYGFPPQKLCFAYLIPLAIRSYASCPTTLCPLLQDRMPIAKKLKKLRFAYEKPRVVNRSEPSTISKKKCLTQKVFRKVQREFSKAQREFHKVQRDIRKVQRKFRHSAHTKVCNGQSGGNIFKVIIYNPLVTFFYFSSGAIIFQHPAAIAPPTNGPTMNTQSCDKALPPSKRAGPMERAGFTEVPV